MSKVRRIDWSPDEWIGGTFGLLTMQETAVYMTVLMVIYSRSDACPNDLAFIDKHFDRGSGDHGRNRNWHQRQVQAALDGLIAKGKLHVSPDGQWLTNGRAEVELNKARERIGGAHRAGVASGAARRSRPAANQPRTSREPAPVKTRSSDFNDLTRTAVRNHQPPYDHESVSTNHTEAAREPSPEPKAAQARAPAKPESETAREARARLAEITAAKRARFMKGQS